MLEVPRENLVPGKEYYLQDFETGYEPVVVRRGPGIRGRLSGIRDSRLTSYESGPMDRADELRQVRELASSQTAFKPLRGIERGSVLPAITRRGGKYKRFSNKGKKTRKNKRRR
jgi:hypothetical protein